MRMADCHPDRKYCARGLCQNCYAARIYATNASYRERAKTRSRLWRVANKAKIAHGSYSDKEYHANWWLHRAHSMTLADRRSMERDQGYKCPICQDPLGCGKVCIDHDSRCCRGSRSCATCRRGVVHDRCNSAIGLLEHNPQKLRNAATYVELHNNRMSNLLTPDITRTEVTI